MKKRLLVSTLLAAALLRGSLPVCAQQDAGALAVILNHYAARDFVAGAIPDADIELIVQAGIRAPSARNLQPWYFTVVQNPVLAKKIVSNNLDGNVLIAVSAPGDGKTNNVQILDCALAVQSVYLAAQALGYGSRIYTGPIDNLNRNFKGELSLPNGYSAVALVRVGKIKPDAVSSASARKRATDLVTHKK